MRVLYRERVGGEDGFRPDHEYGRVGEPIAGNAHPLFHLDVNDRTDGG